MPVPSVRHLTGFAWRRLGLPGVLLLAAVCCDLVIVVASSLDSLDGIGRAGRELWLLPGIIALAACALAAPRVPLRAALGGSAVLLLSTVLMHVTGTMPYTALLEDITFSETVAGVELVYFGVRLLRPRTAFLATAAVVAATMVATTSRTGFFGGGLLQISTVLDHGISVSTLFGGGLLLTVTVLTALHARESAPQRGRVTTLLRQQWLLVGILAGALFLETFYTATAGGAGLLMLACSIGSAFAAVAASRRPTQAAWCYGALVLAAGCIVRLASVAGPYGLLRGMPMSMPLSQVASGMAVVVFCVRYSTPRRARALISLLTVIVAVVTFVNLGSPSTILALFLGGLLLLGISVAVGMYLRARDSERHQAVAAAVSDAQTAERMALARELHDVVAHHVTGIVVQAQAAQLLAQQNPHVVMDALGQIERAGTDAMTAMRRLVSSMRGDAPAGASEFSEQATTDLAADLRRLVDTGTHGVPTELELDVAASVPPEVARSALRLVQESLTNVGKHAHGASRAAVCVRVRDGELHLRVTDDGTGQGDQPAEDCGYGLIGMRERVDLLRGRLSAGPGRDGGWLVEAWLPLSGEIGGKDRS